jgi:tight adherence protein C
MTIATAFIVAGVLLGVATLFPVLRRSAEAHRISSRLQALASRAGAASAPSSPESGFDRLARFESILVTSAKDRAEINEALRAAGWHQPHALLAFGFFRLFGALLGGLATAGALIATDNFSESAKAYPFIAGGSIYVLAKTAVHWRAKERRRRVGAEMPVVLDLLVLMAESGMSLDRCLRQLAHADAAVLPETAPVTRRLVDDIQQGLSYEAALERWAERLGVSGARELAGMFRQSLVNGSDIAAGLREFAREFADKRLAAARESVGVKSAQLSAAMMLFFMPALFILLGGPSVTALLSALGGLR